MKKNRQLLKQEEVRNFILDAARNIISQDGIQGLSIRKITNAIDYSPAIIYHYFKDKNEIVETLVMEGYGRILAAIKSVARNEEAPEKEMKEVFTNYIMAALQNPEEFKAFMLNDDPMVLKKTSILHKGICEESPTMQLFRENVQRGIDQGRVAPCDPEITAQIIWTSVFGLIIKLMVEKDIPQEQVERLIEHNFTILFNGIMIRKEVE
ncbi:transcriptional regulator, TetR family [Natronincola peptidivorans]|uniref:Transcriptional regulator, TetR family n=1 Tax=Natronincola peptidivorans TaxID=426128 RepID=A0A1I0CD36_9FIRM|nr:TetR/AcrR family transcriptional regulator [Natronincola peptidivorans]SET17015.1 transcriptional regulator, TetR family [Natronincola peptidivorans]